MLTKPNSRWLLLATQVVVGVLLVALWRQRSDLVQLKHDYGRLAEQNQLLQQTLHQNKAGAATAPAREPTVTATPPQPHAPIPNQLRWSGAEVTPVSGGLLATLQFNPTKTGPLDEVYVTVELPKTSTAKILDLTPQGAATFTFSGKRVLRDGKFAIFQGTLKEVNSIQLGLLVSGPATVDVRGSCGITPFKLDIAPTNATVRSN